MRHLVALGLVAAVLALAYWAYLENYRTQAALREMARMERAIATQRDALAVLRAEWAYLNRPERLRDLAALNDARLGLVPLAAEAFGRLDEVPYPPPPEPSPGPLAAAGRAPDDGEFP